MRSFKIYGSKQASKHTHTHAQCSHTSVGLAQARPNHMSIWLVTKPCWSTSDHKKHWKWPWNACVCINTQRTTSTKKKGRPGCYAKSPTVQDVFWPTQASSAALGQSGDEDCYIMHKMQSNCSDFNSSISSCGHSLKIVATCEMHMYMYASLIPRPRPVFRRLKYGTASDGKLGEGLGTRLHVCMTTSVFTSQLSPTILASQT